MKKITFLLSFIVCVVFAQAQGLLLVEDFNYPIGSDIKSHGWPIHSGSGANKDSILVVEGLTFDGFIGSGIGGAAGVTNRYCDQNKAFEGQTSGTVYAAFMLKSIASNAAASYFFHFGPSTIGTTYFTRIWINSTGDGIGIGATAPSAYTSITLNTTYLVIMKYDFSNKTSSFYLFSTMPTSEPATANGSFVETTGPAAATPTNIGTVALRQSLTSSVANQNVIVDGIRVATSWQALFITSGTKNLSTDKLHAIVSGKSLLISNIAEGSTIEIYSALGSKVQSSTLENGKVSLNNLSKGMYVVRAGKLTQKIML